MLRSVEEIEAMLKRVDDLLEIEEFEDDRDLTVIQSVLLWVSDTYNADSHVTEYFPEQ